MDDVFDKHIRAPRSDARPTPDDVFARHVRAPEAPSSSAPDRMTTPAAPVDPPPAQRGRVALAPLVPLVAALLVILIAGLGVQAFGGAVVEHPETSATSVPDSVRIPDLQAQSEELREISLGRPVDATRLERERLGALIKEISERDPDPSLSKGADDALHLIGALEGEQSLEAIMEKGLEAQVAGLYDPKTDRLYLIRTAEFDATDSTIVHEIVHALQDHRYDLDALIRPNPSDADAQTAAQSVAEGDATEVQTRYIQRAGAAAALSELSGTLGQLSGASPDQILLPRFLQRSMEFPYTSGAEFVRAVRDAGGEDAVDRAFRTPPRTTLAIMDPQRYLSGRDAPVAVPVPPVEPGSRRVFDTTFGAADVWALIGDRRVAESWRGGRITVDRIGNRRQMHLAIVAESPGVLAAALRTSLPGSATVEVRGRTVVATSAQSLG